MALAVRNVGIGSVAGPFDGAPAVGAGIDQIDTDTAKVRIWLSACKKSRRASDPR